MTYRRIVEAYLETVWTQGQLDQINEFLHPKCRYSDLYGDTVLLGVDEISESVQRWRSMFNSIEYRVVTSVEDDHRIAWQWIITGQWNADFKAELVRTNINARMPDAPYVDISGISFTEFEAGKMTSESTQSDLTGFLRQLGVQ